MSNNMSDNSGSNTTTHTSKNKTECRNALAVAVDNDRLDEESRQQRLQMTDNTAKYKQASNTLLKSEKLLNETEEVGQQVYTTLRTQTETMHHINETTFVVG
uniref:t-SNARE VTI1 n=1 Tax=Lygus hesperus TaxID=30085 RepID=A0A0A9XVG8_LYGHE